MKKRKKVRRQRSIRNFFQGVATVLLIIGAIVGIYLTILYRKRIHPLINYAIVFDAGSSHTEMFVYHWPADKSDGLGETSTVNELFVCPLASVFTVDPLKKNDKIKLKAISDFEQNLDLLADYFRPCLQKAMEKIPENRYKFSPIFLGATAGMRLARLRNENRAKQILETIREIFSTYPFQFVTARQVRILTGMEEAIDGWITTNILLEKFKHRHTEEKRQERLVSGDQLDPDMVGVLDLGGASTQVTFTYTNGPNDEPIPDDFTTNITLFDTIYHPYAHSYLCWGKNEALRRHRARLVLNALVPNRTTKKILLIRDPCFARGANETKTTTHLFDSPCTSNEKQQFYKNWNATSFVFVGTGNASLCQQRLMALYDSKRKDPNINCSYRQEYCTFDHTFQPNLPEKINFIGLSGYYYVFHNLAHGMRKPIGGTTERYRVKDFQRHEIDQRLKYVCETEYRVLYETESMNPSNEQHKRGLCFDAWYVWLLLTYAIGFNDEDLQRLSFANTFPTGKVGWTLGYMINQTNYIPAEYRPKHIEKHHYISWFTISMLIVLLTLIFLLLSCQKYLRKLVSKRSHQLIINKNDGYRAPTEQQSIA